MSGQGDPFEASAAAIGYLFQLRRALLFCLEQLEVGLDWSVAIEAGDDIEVCRADGVDWWQLKHRARGTRITDATSDLWKTLRIWSIAFADESDVTERPNLFLLTTAEAPKGSAAYHLRPPGSDGARDEVKALLLLEKARTESASKSNKAAYEAWDKLTSEQRTNMLSRIQVLDASLDIDQATALLIRRASLVVGHNNAEAFVQRLDGWFLQRVIEQLRSPAAGPVSGLEFDCIFADRRNQFRPDNLPIDEDIVALESEGTDHADKTFVRQLTLVGVGESRVRRAVRDYLRAFVQRSRWSEENLLRPGEIGKYEQRLIEEWETRFEIAVDELGEEAAEEDQCREARKLYCWVELNARLAIRPGCDEPFVTKGSYHLLADELRVGWHPDFVARLMALLEPTGTR